MNYRHVYHAGNFADVFKHVILTLLLQALKQKEKPFVYVDTHAGTGSYDLTSAPARKTSEHSVGIGRLWSQTVVPGALADYLNIVRAANGVDADATGELRHYPGSPNIARALLRAHDRLLLAELQPQECARLKAEFTGDRRAQIHCQDGYAVLNAWLPPLERRGLVFIDPPYEQDSDWDRACQATGVGRTRWPTGMFVIWYPLKAGTPVSRFKRTFKESGWRKILCVEYWVHALDTPFRLNGGGMILINPTFGIEDSLKEVLPFLSDRMQQGSAGGAKVEWLVPE